MAAIAMPEGTTRVLNASVRLAMLPIRGIDRALLAYYRIFEFTDDPRCILRVNLTKSPSAVMLHDGSSVAKGETVAELHLWSQRSMVVGSGIELRNRMQRSFSEFAAFMTQDHRFEKINAVLIRTSACDQFPRSLVEKLATKWGFEIDDSPRSRAERFSEFWDNVYIALLGLAYPSGPLHVRRNIERLHLWISRKSLLEHHLPGAAAS